MKFWQSSCFSNKGLCDLNSEIQNFVFSLIHTFWGQHLALLISREQLNRSIIGDNWYPGLLFNTAVTSYPSRYHPFIHSFIILLISWFIHSFIILLISWFINSFIILLISWFITFWLFKLHVLCLQDLQEDTLTQLRDI